MFFAFNYLKLLKIKSVRWISKSWSSILLLIVILIIILLWWNTQFIISYLTNIGYSDCTKRGAYGDSYGFTTSLISSLTFILVLYGIYYQRKEMSTQKEMLDLSKRQHYFDRAYEFLDKNLSQLNSAQTNVLSKIHSERYNQYSEVWEQ